ncbi:tryptophan synthase alpha chain [Algisphaera agarilytica]|uniref:Tryptophan synthase alpha chain n=2 Tax=Algisphaera agarilytica TaxID=1385975 RepID=A0A7X0LLJ4_9BACT|nr:tryptophan synthase alpha chain [Algisphaera agarilytica]
MPFLTAGDPDLATTIRMLEAAQEAGASICEIGIPFSDPIADGPVIQASMSRALDQGLKVEEVFAAVAEARPRLSIGLVAMVSYSIVHRMGLKQFIGRAKEAGFDGFIFPDLPLAESGPARAAAAEAGLILSMLIAPTTPIERAEQIAAASTGFVYVVSRPGITGARASLPPELPARLERLRGVTDLPMAVGFGISSAEQVREVVSVADAAIVGSALVAQIHEYAQESADAAVTGAGSTIAQLTQGLTSNAP